jgi:hypothetical protein
MSFGAAFLEAAHLETLSVSSASSSSLDSPNKISSSIALIMACPQTMTCFETSSGETEGAVLSSERGTTWIVESEPLKTKAKPLS